MERRQDKAARAVTAGCCCLETDLPNHPLDVDVVIPVRDGARFLPACLDSVMAQTRPPRAVVVVDDGSTDATPQILAEYQQRWPILETIRSAPRGVSHARNLALAHCRASFVAFLDADDLWEPAKLERQMALFDTGRPRLGFVHCAYRLIDQDGRSVHNEPIQEPRKRGEIFSELLRGGNIVSGSGSAVLARRALIDTVGGFDERLFLGEDWDLWLRLAAIAEIDFVPERLLAVRAHEASAQRRERAQRREVALFQNLIVLDRWYGTKRFPPGMRDQCRRQALNVAVTREARLLPRPAHVWRLYLTLRRCDSRIGRELFAGPVDFVFALLAHAARAALRAALGWRHAPSAQASAETG